MTANAPDKRSIAIIACGALVRDVMRLREKYGWSAEIVGVPALLHDTPWRIPSAVSRRIREMRSKHARVVVVYGDCGTAGGLDAALAAEGVERIAGPHCCEMYAAGIFDQIMAESPGTFFLTDYMAASFERVVLKSLGLDRHPELRQNYFGNYGRVVYLAQREDPQLLARARRAAEQLRLPLETRHVGLGALETRLLELVGRC